MLYNELPPTKGLVAPDCKTGSGAADNQHHGSGVASAKGFNAYMSIAGSNHRVKKLAGEGNEERGYGSEKENSMASLSDLVGERTPLRMAD